MIVVADSTPLIALARIDQLNLLKELFGAVLIPEAVFREVVTRGKGRPGSEEVLRTDWIKVQSPNDRAKVVFLLSDLDEGEADQMLEFPTGTLCSPENNASRSYWLWQGWSFTSS